MSEKIFIYGLYDPIVPSCVRYVGQTENLENRFAQHQAGGDRATRAWVETVRQQGRPIGFKILETVTVEKAGERETYWISQFPDSTLLNRSKSGSNRKPFPPAGYIDGVIPMREVLGQYAKWAIGQYPGNKKAAANALQISRQTLYNLVREADKITQAREGKK